MQRISSIKSLIDTWPTRKALADEIGVPAERVHKWAQTGSIPARFHGSLLRAAVARGIPVTAWDLVCLHDESGVEDAA